jgi:putative transposase
VSQACNGKILALLDYKTAGAIQIDEHFTSQTCPVCGARTKCRRTYQCACGVRAPRDVIGALNIRTNGQFGEIKTGQTMPTVIKYLRPLGRSSPRGHLASCSV